MKITNNAGLPEPIVRAVEWSDRDIGNSDYTITQLIKPPRMVALERTHREELTEDATDRIWALMGSAAHEVLRRSAPDGQIVEKRFFATVAGKVVSGQIDYSPETAEVFDYKFTSVWAVKEGVKPEWEQQLNAYRYLLHVNEIRTPETLSIVAILRDWSKLEAKRNRDYPQVGVMVLPVRIWPVEHSEKWIRGRIEEHETAKTTLPDCTEEDMWAKPAVYAVKKKGGSRAIPGGLCKSNDEATKLIGGDPKLEIEFRPGERIRCASYCSVADHCIQYRTWLDNQQGYQYNP